MRSQHRGYWCPGAKAPGHQFPQCWLNIHCIGPISYKNIAHKVNSIRKWNRILTKKWPSHLRVKLTTTTIATVYGDIQCLQLKEIYQFNKLPVSSVIIWQNYHEMINKDLMQTGRKSLIPPREQFFNNRDSMIKIPRMQLMPYIWSE